MKKLCTLQIVHGSSWHGHTISSWISFVFSLCLRLFPSWCLLFMLWLNISLESGCFCTNSPFYEKTSSLLNFWYSISKIHLLPSYDVCFYLTKYHFAFLLWIAFSYNFMNNTSLLHWKLTHCHNVKLLWYVVCICWVLMYLGQVVSHGLVST